MGLFISSTTHLHLQNGSVVNLNGRPILSRFLRKGGIPLRHQALDFPDAPFPSTLCFPPLSSSSSIQPKNRCAAHTHLALCGAPRYPADLPVTGKLTGFAEACRQQLCVFLAHPIGTMQKRVIAGTLFHSQAGMFIKALIRKPDGDYKNRP